MAGGIKFSTRVDGMQRLDRMIQSMAIKGNDLRPWFENVLDPSLDDFFKKMWRSLGTAGGERWAPLRPATIEWRAAGTSKRSRVKNKRGEYVPVGGSRPLFMTGRAFRAWTRPGADSVREFNTNRYTRSSRIGYDAIHMSRYLVTRWGRVVFRSPRMVPARRIIPERMPRAQVGAWEASLANFILKETGSQPFKKFGYGQSRGLP